MMDFAFDGCGDVDDGFSQIGLVLSSLTMEDIIAADH